MVIDDLAAVLHPDQRYVTTACAELGINIAACRHASATSSCVEKAAILGWSASRVVKALYFSNDSTYIGVVIPELFRRIDAVGLFADILNISRKQAKRFQLGRFPLGMEQGTCTPFPLHQSLVSPRPEISRIVIHHEPHVMDSVVDISIGGKGERAHRLSCHLKYAAIYDVLSFTFGAAAELRSLTGYLVHDLTVDVDPPIPRAVGSE
jgi:hypothetical protein